MRSAAQAPLPLAQRLARRGLLPLLLGLVPTALLIQACGDDAENNLGTTPVSDAGDSDDGELRADGAAEGDSTAPIPDNVLTGAFGSVDARPSKPIPLTPTSGGLLQVTLSHGVSAQIWLTSEAGAEPLLGWESSYFDEAETGAPGTFTVRLHGAIDGYQVRLAPLNFLEGGDNPYHVSWELTPLPDAHEPNDTAATATAIETDTSIAAILHAGIGPNDTLLVSSTADDWYKFSLATARTVTLSADYVESPGHVPFFALYDSPPAGGDAGASAPLSKIGAQTETTESPGLALEPGDYWLQVGLDRAENAGTHVGDELPAHFNTGYTFTVGTAATAE